MNNHLLSFDSIKANWCAIAVSPHNRRQFLIMLAGATEYMLVDTVDLEAVDQVLPDVMRHYAELQLADRACQLLQKTLAYWEHNLVLPVEAVANTYRTTYCARVQEVLHWDAATVTVLAEQWDIWHHAQSSRDLVIWYDTQPCILTNACLEQQCKGSVQRLHLAAGLDLVGQTLHGYVFTALTPVASPPLPDALCSTLVASA